MATQNKIIEMIGAIKTLYSYYAKDTDVKLLVKTWTALLERYPDEVVDVAFFKCLQTCKVPPTPADVIEQINALAKANEQSDEELWTIYYQALMNTLRLLPQFDYTYVDATGVSQGEQARRKVSQIWDSLPDKIKVYLASKSELIRNARELNYTDASWEKQRFMKSMPIVAKRQECSNFLKIEQVKRFFLE